MKIEHQQRMYDTLRRIARDYQKAEKLLAKGEFGLSGEETLEAAYDNIQAEAAAAIRGLRRPIALTRTPKPQ